MLETQLARFGAVPFGHSALLPLLEGYQRPNDKIAQWLRQEVLVSLKRGLYVVGPAWRRGELSLPLVANRLYGPSCVSLDYALSWHGLIPERVHVLTSVCMRRGRVFDNSLGRFSYVTLPASLFPVGVVQEVVSSEQHFLIASPAKALCDKVVLTRHLQVAGMSGMQRFLFEDLRLDEAMLTEVVLDWSVLEHYAASGHKPRQMRALLKVLEAMR
ncbi:MAG: hypothetical protein LAT61_15670 [Alcanivorax sp.]|nr:hypothetical protein [Alcanivorax sp.]